ncbi:MAG: hypothetical protein VKL97_04070 [Cyanobacteriota bacterium]|nr:hypothetical protein [Cyanobacteriota bacterium]
MADAPYLIAIALIEQNGRRQMPLQGKSLRTALGEHDDPGEVGRQQALELLLRLWQRSDEGSLKRAAGSRSLLLAQVPIETLQEQLPQLKADWLNGGDTETLLQELRALSSGLWCLSIEPRSASSYERI